MITIGAESIIKPLRPLKLDGWIQHQPPPQWVSMGYAAERWQFGPLCVISAVEVAIDGDGVDRGPSYHISISRYPQLRCTSNEAAWVLEKFGAVGFEEDNHVPHGFVRNFWRSVAEPLIGQECACKATEPAIVEDKGDFVWRPAP